MNIIKSKGILAEGNIANQRYVSLASLNIQSTMIINYLKFIRFNAEQHAKRHHDIVFGETLPTRETSRWREDLDLQFSKRDTKKDDKQKVKILKIETENERIAERIYDIMKDSREATSREYLPGWRIGKGGTVIDCYRSTRNDSEKFSSMHGR